MSVAFVVYCDRCGKVTPWYATEMGARLGALGRGWVADLTDPAQPRHYCSSECLAERQSQLDAQSSVAKLATREQ